MKKQKFKRGNLVHIAKDLGSMMSHFESDRDAIIIGSYADKYGGDDTDSYSVMFPETGGSCSWYFESQLTLIDEGGEHLFKEAKKNRERISKRNKDIKYIASELDNGFSLNSESILFLFDLIGYESSFNRNGEFFILYDDWLKLYPIFVHLKNAETLNVAKAIFTEHGLSKLNIEKVYNLFHIYH